MASRNRTLAPLTAPQGPGTTTVPSGGRGPDLQHGAKRWVVITGGARRIGAAIARRFASSGWNLLLHHNRSRDACSALASELRSANGVRVHVLAADFRSNTAADELADAAATLGIAPTALVNNASIFPRGSLAQTPAEEMAVTWAVNVTAPARLMARLAGSGSLRAVINLLDSRVDGAWRERSTYLASKAALASLTRSAALELAPRVRVNGLALGPTLQADGAPAAWPEAVLSRLPSGAPVDPEVVAELALLLADERLDCVTGAIWTVDGGRRLG